MIEQKIRSEIILAIVNDNLGQAQLLIQNALGTSCSFQLVRNKLDDGNTHAVAWQILSPQNAILWLPESAFAVDGAIVRRLTDTLPLLYAYHASGEVERGRVMLNLGDAGIVPGLAFSDWRPEFYLVPDPAFLVTRAYAYMRVYFEQQAIPWDQRAKIAFWRGGSSGHSEGGGWNGLPRVRLCRLAVRYPELLDAGITHTATESVANALEAERLTRARVSEGEFGRYRYQIDIDGNSNAWSGLFIKLLTGSPVLKIQSRKGYRQWYYDKLVPWYNFVPISAGMADLPAKLCWLAEHDHEAREIGQRGRELALSMTCEKEIAGVLHAITCAVREAGLASGQCALTEQNGPPTDAILVKVGTNHGTRLLMDMIRGELRHGPATSPDNVYLAIRGDIGQLMYLTPEGVHYKIGLIPACSDQNRAPALRSDAVCTEFNIVRGSDSTIGLASDAHRRGGLLLCAEPDGRVTLSRTVLGPWERFELVESGTSGPEVSTLPAGPPKSAEV